MGPCQRFTNKEHIATPENENVNKYIDNILAYEEPSTYHNFNTN